MSDASIKVIELLDELEELLGTSSKVPFSDKAIVDSEEILNIIEDMRLSMPEDIQQAKWVKDEQQRILGEAKSEYDKIIIAAKKQAEYLIETNAIKKEAERRANALLIEAENHNRYVKLRSCEYIDKLLFNMQNDITKIAEEYIQPMNEQFNQTFNEVNTKFNENRTELSKMAENIENEGDNGGEGDNDDRTYSLAGDDLYEEED